MYESIQYVRQFLLLFLVLHITFAGEYEGFKIYKTITKTPRELERLINWARHVGGDLLQAGTVSHIMVAPDAQANFEHILNENNYQWKILENIDDYIKNIDKKRARKRKVLRKGQYSFDDYQRYQVMTEYLDKIAKDYSKYVVVKNEGLSYENRTIKSVRITDGSGNSSKATMFIDCGIHAREWMSSTFCMYLIQELTENRLNNKDMLERVDWFIVPLINPDGYEYSHTKKRFWRKNRSVDDLKPECNGADLNRNFPYKWSLEGSSDDLCSEIFRGRIPFSEPESLLLGKLIVTEAKKNPGRMAYLTIHSFGSFLLYPWGYSDTVDLPPSINKLEEVSNKVVEAVQKYSGNTYQTGNSARILYPAAGGSDDFAMGIAGVDLSFTVELSPSLDESDYYDDSTADESNDDYDDESDYKDTYPMCYNGFFPPAEMIKPICQETMVLIREVGNYLADNH